MRSGNERHAADTWCLGKGFEAAWAHFRPSKPCVSLSTDGIVHCTKAGEIEIPLKLGKLTEDRISGEIGSLILGKTAGRRSACDITVFDATGMALLDLAAAECLLKKR